MNSSFNSRAKVVSMGEHDDKLNHASQTHFNDSDEALVVNSTPTAMNTSKPQASSFSSERPRSVSLHLKPLLRILIIIVLMLKI